jgi:hypothetical protein
MKRMWDICTIVVLGNVSEGNSPWDLCGDLYPTGNRNAVYLLN